MCLYAVTGFCENNYGDFEYSGKMAPLFITKKTVIKVLLIIHISAHFKICLRLGLDIAFENGHERTPNFNEFRKQTLHFDKRLITSRLFQLR